MADENKQERESRLIATAVVLALNANPDKWERDRAIRCAQDKYGSLWAHPSNLYRATLLEMEDAD